MNDSGAEAPSQGPDVDERRAANRARFELELEFVQALANPFYLQSLAQQNILEQPAFINYLKYLLYWKEKDYARFIHYPHALHHLELLQHERFRTEMKKDDFFREFLHQKQFDHWRTWRNPSHLNSSSSGGDPASATTKTETDFTMPDVRRTPAIRATVCMVASYQDPPALGVADRMFKDTGCRIPVNEGFMPDFMTFNMVTS